jgi:Tfp pilus assembly protein PilN
MERINFLPLAYQRADARRALAVALVVVALGGFSSAAALWSVVRVERSFADSEVAAKLSPKPVASTPKPVVTGSSLVDTNTRVAQINLLGTKELNWQNIYDMVGALIPKDTRLGSLDATSDGITLTLTLSGTSPSNHSFADFVASLKQNKALSTANVVTYAYSPTLRNVNFSIICTLPVTSVEYQKKK